MSPELSALSYFSRLCPAFTPQTSQQKRFLFPLSMETLIPQQSDVLDLEEESGCPVAWLSSSKENAVMQPRP